MSSHSLRQWFILTFSFVLSFQAKAADIEVQIDSAKPIGQFSIGAGSDVSLIPADATQVKGMGPSLFITKAISPMGRTSFQIYLNKADKKLYYFSTSHFEKSSELQKVLNPFAQAGSTCTGYAIYDFLQQSHLSGFKGNGLLAQKLSSELGRTTLLVDNINEYYLTPKHQYSISGILNKYGKEMGFTCSRAYRNSSYEKVQKRLLDHLSTGRPVVISFNLGPNMYQSPLKMVMYDDPKTKMDHRLWIPRKRGERNNGGHTIVAAAAFEFRSKNYLLVIDSDWSEPRVWDMEAFLNEKTALDEVELITCQEPS